MLNEDFEKNKEASLALAIINLDDFTHIDFLEKTIGHIPETISCRYNPGGVFKMSNGIMDNPGDAKYGFTHEQIIEGFKLLKENERGLFVVIGLLAYVAQGLINGPQSITTPVFLIELGIFWNLVRTETIGDKKSEK